MGLFELFLRKLDRVAHTLVAQEGEFDQDEFAAYLEEDSRDHRFDLAGFDIDDEEAFFEAAMFLERYGESVVVSEFMKKYQLRDVSHWRQVKGNFQACLIQKHGSSAKVSERETSYREWRQLKTSALSS